MSTVDKSIWDHGKSSKLKEVAIPSTSALDLAIQPFVSLNRETIEEEMRIVESKHEQIMQELSLSLEEMLLNESESLESDQTNNKFSTEDISRRSLSEDSGFTGSTSSCSYTRSIGAAIDTVSSLLLSRINYPGRSVDANEPTVAYSLQNVCILDDGYPLNFERYHSLNESRRCKGIQRNYFDSVADLSYRSTDRKPKISDALWNYTFWRKTLIKQRTPSSSSDSQIPAQDTCDVCLVERC